MFGVGPQELLIVGLLVLVIFGPIKAAGMARDLGRFVNGANRTVEEFKSEVMSEEVEEARRTFEESKTELLASAGGEEREARPREPHVRKS